MLVHSGRYDAISDRLTAAFLNKLHAQRVDVGQWQSQDISDRPEMVTWEIPHVVLEYVGDGTDIPANQPWAEQHFQERVGRVPVNPPPSHEIWPHAQNGNDQFTGFNGTFSHTYPERLWCRFASPYGHEALGVDRPWDEMVDGWKSQFGKDAGNAGIRFRYGDLEDVVQLLRMVPHTRQAFLPIWFPEDTGAHHGARVPCTLGYHFLVRDQRMACSYFIRSCDYRRHFADDLWLAHRLAQWVSDRVSEAREDSSGSLVKVDRVVMHITSLHIFEGDRPLMEREWDAKMQRLQQEKSAALMKGF